MEYKPKNREWVKNAAIIFLAVLLVLTFFSQTIMNRTLPEVATQYVTDGSITAKVRGTGKVTAEGRYDVKADQTREIRAVMVKVGQEVKVGDVLFVLGEGSGEELETAQEKLHTLETSYARAAAGISYPDYKYDEMRIVDAKKAMDEAEKILKDYEGIEGNEAIQALIAQRGAAENELNREDGLVAQRDAEQEKYDAAVAAAEDALTLAVADRDMAQRQLTLDGVTIVDSGVDSWRFLYQGHSIEYMQRADLGTADERWTFVVDAQTNRSQVTVDVFGNVLSAEGRTLSAVSGRYTPAPLVYTVQPGEDARPLLAALFGGVRFTLLAADPVGSLEQAGLLEDAAQVESGEAPDPMAELQTPPVNAAEPLPGSGESPEGESDPGSGSGDDGTDDPGAESNETADNGSSGEGDITDAPGNGSDPGMDSPGTNEPGTDPVSEPGSGSGSSEEEPVEIPRHIYAQIILYCKGELGIRDAKYNLENVPREALDAAQGNVTAKQAEVDGIQNQIDQIMATLPTSSAYITAQANYQAARSTYISLVEALENKQQADSQTQSLAYIDLTDLAAQIERQKEKIAELSGGEDNQILAKVNGTVQSLGCVAGDTKVKDDVLCTIEVPDRGYYLEFSVTNEQARRLRVGDSASVSNYYWGNQVQATLRSITVDPKNPQTNKILTFDLSGDVTSGADLTISVGQKSANYDTIIPNSAIRSDTNGTFVYVVEAKNSPLGNRYIARRVEVEVLAEDDSNSAVTGNLSYGSYVITTSNAPLKNGDLVRLADNG